MPWRTVSTRFYGPAFAGRRLGKTPLQRNSERKIHLSRLTHYDPDLNVEAQLAHVSTLRCTAAVSSKLYV